MIMKKISININSDSRTIKYSKIKQIKFNSIKIIKDLRRFKKLLQIIEKYFNFINLIK